MDAGDLQRAVVSSRSILASDGQAPFGPEIAVPENAPPADRLAGFLGRRP